MSKAQNGSAAYAKLVEPDRVHKSLYTDQEIFQAELDNIFYKSWIYVGHESQVKEPGDYWTTVIGEQPMIFVRGEDGNCHVLYNRCPHRGAIMCPDRYGNAGPWFRCTYHAWQFSLDGSLMTIPVQKGYDGTRFDPDDEQFQMRRAARVESYRGFVFASLSAKGPDLAAHLGHARASIDELVDKAPGGAVDLLGGVHKYLFRGNWKLQMENTVDMYHVPFSHESTLRRDGRQFSRRRGDPVCSPPPPLASLRSSSTLSRSFLSPIVLALRLRPPIRRKRRRRSNSWSHVVNNQVSQQGKEFFKGSANSDVDFAFVVEIFVLNFQGRH